MCFRSLKNRKKIFFSGLRIAFPSGVKLLIHASSEAGDQKKTQGQISDSLHRQGWDHCLQSLLMSSGEPDLASLCDQVSVDAAATAPTFLKG